MDPTWQVYLENLFDNKLGSVNQNIKAMETKLDKNIEVLNKNLTTITDEIKSIKNEQIKQGVELEHLKREERGIGLVFHGLGQQSYRETLTRISEILGSVGVQDSKYLIKNIRKLGTGNWDEKPILVSLVSNPLKIDILRNKKSIGEKFPGVMIKEDMTKETREIRTLLGKYSKMAIQNNMKTTMRKDKLVINGKIWTLEELQRDTSNSFLNKSKRAREEGSPPNPTNTKKQLSQQTPLRKTNSIENFLKKATPMDTTMETLKDKKISSKAASNLVGSSGKA
ncbi:hypothetical protein M8J76_009450 [Diaphorina citri]|nr:hypothetical protein M8J76_009450 [Diaphorina citri]